MKLFNLTMLTAALFLMNACVYKPVSVNLNKDTNFKELKTFAWIPERDTLAISDSLKNTYKNDLIKNMTMNYINHCMMLRGYKIDTLNPDLLLDLKLLDEKKEELRQYSYPIGYSYPYFGYYYYPYPFHYTFYGGYAPYWNRDAYKISYTKRTINLNFIDRKNKQIVWAGTTVGDIYDPRYSDKYIHPGIHRLMKRYPVKPVVKKIKF
ncbi:MAG: DUF4136 domain-containing protein [Cytophagaceae bacterium]|nr:DUF4136 domain-containing protein [Cytophagaceae bacterium]